MFGYFVLSQQYSYYKRVQLFSSAYLYFTPVINTVALMEQHSIVATRRQVIVCCKSADMSGTWYIRKHRDL